MRTTVPRSSWRFFLSCLLFAPVPASSRALAPASAELTRKTFHPQSGLLELVLHNQAATSLDAWKVSVTAVTSDGGEWRVGYTFDSAFSSNEPSGNPAFAPIGPNEDRVIEIQLQTAAELGPQLLVSAKIEALVFSTQLGEGDDDAIRAIHAARDVHTDVYSAAHEVLSEMRASHPQVFGNRENLLERIHARSLAIKHARQEATVSPPAEAATSAALQSLASMLDQTSTEAAMEQVIDYVAKQAALGTSYRRQRESRP